MSSTKTKKEIWRDEYPFDSHFLKLDEVRMHYVDEGTGDPMLFVHGNPTWSFYYRHLIREFSATHRCVAMDHIGCGLSDKPQDYPYLLQTHIDNAVALVQELNLRNITLCVHDWGGAIGMGVAARMPDRIKRLVVFNTSAFYVDHMPLSIGICRVPAVGAVAIRGLNGFVRGALARCAKKPLTPEAKAGYLAPYDSWASRVANLRFVQDIPTVTTHPSWDALKSVDAGLNKLKSKPMLICWGGRDFCFNDKFLTKWRKRFPDARVEYFDDSGHFVIEDAREPILTAMHEFMETHP